APVNHVAVPSFLLLFRSSHHQPHPRSHLARTLGAPHRPPSCATPPYLRPLPRDASSGSYFLSPPHLLGGGLSSLLLLTQVSEMSVAEAKAAVVPESVLRKRKREEQQWDGGTGHSWLARRREAGVSQPARGRAGGGSMAGQFGVVSAADLW
ncbi:unnamed protein product, partial [Urochloa humidicola]